MLMVMMVGVRLLRVHLAPQMHAIRIEGFEREWVGIREPVEPCKWPCIMRVRLLSLRVLVQRWIDVLHQRPLKDDAHIRDECRMHRRNPSSHPNTTPEGTGRPGT